MSLPNVFKLIKIDDNDTKYVNLKKILLNELKSNVTCDDYDSVASYVFHCIIDPSCSYESLNKEFIDLFEDKARYFMDVLIKNSENIYRIKPSNNEGEEDLLDEVYKKKADLKPKVTSKTFNLGGKKVVLKSNKHDDEENIEENKRERSRDKFHGEFQNTNNFHVPRGMIRGSYIRYPRPAIRGPPVRINKDYIE